MGIEDPLRGLRWISINTNPIFTRGTEAPSKVVTTFIDVTEQREAEARLASATVQLQDLYDHAPCGYYSLDAAGLFLNANVTQLSWLGCGRDEVIGRRAVTEFLTDEGRATFQENFPRMMAQGQIEGLEFDLLGRALPPRRVSVKATVVRNDAGEFVMTRSVMYDISGLYEARQQLAQRALEQHAMLDNELIGMARLCNRVAVWKNRAMGRIFGYEPDELLGKSSRILFASDAEFAAFGRACYPVLQAGQHYRTQLQMVRKDGSPIWIDISGAESSLDHTESLWMFVDISAMKHTQAQIEHIAYHDALTGLPNRILLADRLRQAVLHAQRGKELLAVCYLDLDGFKPVNDTHGHAAGDLLLKEVARRLQWAIRGNDTAARLGGDEFVLILTELSSHTESLAVLQRVLSAIEEETSLPGIGTVRVSATLGVALFPKDGLHADVLLGHADQAMYQGKRKGRRQICYFDATVAEPLEAPPKSE